MIHSIRKITFYIIWIIILCSCSKKVIKPEINNNLDRLVFASAFHQDTMTRAFDLHIYVRKKHVSGVLFLNYMSDSYRFTLLSKMGQKLFDIELHGDRIQVRSIIEDLNKKVILNQLQKDFSLLVMACANPNIRHVIENDEKTTYGIESCGSNSIVHFTFKDHFDTPIVVGSGGRNRPRRWANFHQFKFGIPHYITIEHRSLINLRLELKLLDLTKN